MKFTGKIQHTSMINFLQAALVEGMSDRIVMGEEGLSKLKEELREVVETNGVNIGEMRDDVANAKAFAE